MANWKAAGAVILGRTNTPGFSFRLDTDNELRGPTFNPWSQAHTPGGSSGGAASSVAAGITPLSHGNDIAGSIRYPAYACGLAGLRPSFGRVPAFNPSATAERAMSAQILLGAGAARANGAGHSPGSLGDGRRVMRAIRGGCRRRSRGRRSLRRGGWRS